MTSTLTSLTLASAIEKLCRRESTPTDLVEACLAKIDELEPQLKAWVMVDAAGARKLAAEQTLAYQRGAPLGPLAGIPVGVKDIIDVAGWPTKAGSPLRENHVAEQDAPVVAALRRAGAILLGKTVTTQFACFDPAPTRNPHNLDYSPGGSSSGSAAAVACGMCFAALGTQTGGSIIRPAAYCGVAGLKPTFGAISTEGVVPVSPRLDHVGVLARTAGDVEAVWYALHGESPTKPKFTSSLQQVYVESVRVAPTMKGIARGLKRFGRWMGNQGIRVVMPPHPGAFRIGRITWDYHRKIMARDAASTHADLFQRHPDAFATGLAGLLREGLEVSADDYDMAIYYQDDLRREIDTWLRMVEVIFTPATTSLAPPLSAHSTGDPRWNSPFSLSGHPALTIPIGRGPHHLPWGIQLVGPYGGEARLLEIAKWIESVLG